MDVMDLTDDNEFDALPDTKEKSQTYGYDDDDYDSTVDNPKMDRSKNLLH